jgi:tetratricopeptide (TPR) repeat protein
VVNRVFPLVDLWVTSSLCQRYVAQAQACAAHIEEWGIVSLEAGRLLTELARYLYELSQYEMMGYAQARRLLERSLAIFAHLSETGILVAKAQLFLGWVSMALGHYTHAMVCSEQAWTILRKFLPSDLSALANYPFDLAKLGSEQSKHQAIELLYTQALEIVEHHRGPEHPHVASNLANLGAYYCNQERYSDAEPLLLRALEISQKALGREHPLTAYILQELGRLYLEQGHYAQAEQLLLQAIEIRKQVLKPGHQDIAFSLKALGRLYLEQGQHAQAEALLLQALEISQKTMGSEHSQTAPLLNNLIGLCRAKGAAREAEALFLRALKIDQKTLESERSRIMFTYALLAFLASLVLTARTPSEQ